MEQIQATTKKNEKVELFANFLRQLIDKELPLVCYYASGRAFSKISPLKIQMGWSSCQAVVNKLTKYNRSELSSFYRKNSDFGSMVEFALNKRKPQAQPLESYFSVTKQEPKLTILMLNEFFTEIATISGKRAIETKKNRLLSFLQLTSPLEAKYVTRIITSDTRTGFREGLVLDSIVKAFNREKEEVEYAHMILSDIGKTAVRAKDSKINLFALKPELFNPLKSMLATKVETISKALEAFPLLICEPKIDGFRAQLHISKKECKLYSRNQEDITQGFPEIIDDVSIQVRHDYQNTIIDGEVVAIVDGKPVFFQDLLTRVLRKQEVEESILKTPCYFYMFDITLSKGESLLNKPLLDRKKALNTIPTLKHLEIIRYKILSDETEIKNFFQQMIKRGFEGLMLKDPHSKYLAGKRGKNWLKLKTSLPTLDLVIIAAEWGHGRRTGWLSNYHLAARDKNNYQVIGKTFKGLTDSEFQYLTDLLNSIKTSAKSWGIAVKPQVVVEVEFDNIQQSSKYESGMALRFARIKRIRPDKSVEEIDTIKSVQQLYENQLERQERSKQSQ